jgi:hypothetical protein
LHGVPSLPHTLNENHGGDNLVLFGCSVDIPQADGVIITGRQQVSVLVGVPR